MAGGSGDRTGLQQEKSEPRSLALANNGIRTGAQFASVMSALMSDAISGAVPPGVVNAACNAGGKLLKVVELQQKYGTTENGKPRSLDLLS